MIPGAEDEILKPDRMLMMQQEQQSLHRSVSEGHLLKTQISIKEEVNPAFGIKPKNKKLAWKIKSSMIILVYILLWGKALAFNYLTFQEHTL